MRPSYGEQVVALKPDEVFVFGSNADGFHGAGAAGFASFGVPGNRWREFGYADKPDGWRGKWNVKGQAEGLQEGTEGMSYALPTVIAPGQKRSLSRHQITLNIMRMYSVARSNPNKRFLVAGFVDGKHSLNGYTHKEMAKMYAAAGPIPDNVIFSDSYTQLVFRVDSCTGHTGTHQVEAGNLFSENAPTETLRDSGVVLQPVVGNSGGAA